MLRKHGSADSNCAKNKRFSPQYRIYVGYTREDVWIHYDEQMLFANGQRGEL